MLNYAGLSIANYDQLFKGWSTQPVKPSVTLSAFGRRYCFAESERQSLITDHSWTVTDFGKSCTPFAPTSITYSGPATVGDNQTSTTDLGTLTATVATTSPYNSHTYSLACTNPGADDARFSIDGNMLQLVSSPDAHAQSSLRTCVRVTDAAGQTYDRMLSFALLDIAPPATPQPPVLDAASDTGEDTTDGITDDTTPTIHLVCSEAGSTLTIYVNGVAGETIDCTAAGDVSFIFSDLLADGDYDITYTETDAAGNASEQSSALSITIATTSQVEDDNDGSGSGTNAKDPSDAGSSGETLSQTGANVWVVVGLGLLGVSGGVYGLLRRRG